MNVRKSDGFIADVERQFEWYAINASWEIAEHYLTAVEATCALLAAHRFLGPAVGSGHPQLQGWRFLVVLRPFNKHVLFYEVAGTEVLMRRAMHGHRNLPHQRLDPPEIM